MKQGTIARNRQTDLEGIIQKLMGEVARLSPHSHGPDHLGPLFTGAAHHFSLSSAQDQTLKTQDLRSVFNDILKTNHLKKSGLQVLISYYLRKLCSLKESALRYELNIAA